MTFTATDDGDGAGTPLATNVTVPITVFNTNRPPQIVEFPNIPVQRDENGRLDVETSDLDGNPIVLTAVNALPGLPLPDFIENLVHHGTANITGIDDPKVANSHPCKKMLLPHTQSVLPDTDTNVQTVKRI